MTAQERDALKGAFRTVLTVPVDLTELLSSLDSIADEIFAASSPLLLSGAGVPASGLGNDGDLYFDTAAHAYYLKASGAWTLQSSLIGPSGPAGTDGADGTDGTTPDLTPVARTGDSSAIALDNNLGGAIYTNSGAAMTHTTYSISGVLEGAFAYVLANTATSPTLTGAAKVGDFDANWPTSTDAFFIVYRLNGTTYAQYSHPA